MRLAAPQGFEPRYPAPEAGVLPLNEGAACSVAGSAERNGSIISA